MLKPILAASALLLWSTSAFAAPTATPAAKPAAANLVCPVTHEKIASVKDSVGHSTYKGKTYYFCCSACKPMFDKNPAAYVKSAKADTAKPMPKM